MRNKEFEAQKQELLQQLDVINQQGFDYNDYVYLHDTISELQPPKPPTCATCEHYSSEHSGFGVCQKGVREFEPPFEYQDCNLVNINFSCVFHSDYRDAE